MPGVGAAAQYGDVGQSRRDQFGRRASGPAIGLAHDNDRLAAGGEFRGPVSDFRERHIARPRNMAWRGVEFLGLADVDKQRAITGGKPLPQLGGFDPYRLRNRGSAGQARYEFEHGR